MQRQNGRFCLLLHHVWDPCEFAIRNGLVYNMQVLPVDHVSSVCISTMCPRPGALEVRVNHQKMRTVSFWHAMMVQFQCLQHARHEHAQVCSVADVDLNSAHTQRCSRASC